MKRVESLKKSGLWLNLGVYLLTLGAPIMEILYTPKPAKAAEKNAQTIALSELETALFLQALEAANNNGDNQSSSPDVEAGILQDAITQTVPLTTTETTSEMTPAEQQAIASGINIDAWAAQLGVSQENFTIIFPDKIEITPLTEEEYHTELAAAQQTTQQLQGDQQQQLNATEAEETTIFELPNIVQSRAIQLGLSNDPCLTEAFIGDGVMSPDSINFKEVTDSSKLPPEGTSYFEAYGVNQTQQYLFAILSSLTFLSSETSYTKRIVTFFVRKDNLPIVPGGITSIASQLVHTDGNVSTYGMVVGKNEELFTTSSWVRVAVTFRLRGTEERSNKISITISLPNSPDTQQYLVDAVQTDACPDGIYLPSINTKAEPPKELNTYLSKGWLAIQKLNAALTDEAFRTLITKNYGVVGADISPIYNSWVAVNPNTLYFTLLDETQDETVTLTFSDIETKNATVISNPTDTIGATGLGFLPFSGFSLLQTGEILAPATLVQNGRNIYGVVFDAFKVAKRFGSVPLALSTFFFEDFYRAPETMRAANAPILLVYRDGKAAGGISITAGTRPVSNIDLWQQGKLPPLTFVNRRQLERYIPDAATRQKIIDKAQWTFGNTWLILQESDLAGTNVPVLADADPQTIINPDKMSQGSLEAIMMTEGLYSPSIVPPEFANTVNFAVTERQRVISTITNSFQAVGLNVHQYLSAAFTQASQQLLELHGGYVRGNPLIETYDVKQDLNYSVAQLQHLTAVITESITILLNHMDTDLTNQQQSLEQIAILQGELNIIQNRLNALGGSDAVSAEIASYVSQYQQLLAQPNKSDGEKITFTYLQDDTDGSKRATAYFQMQYETLVARLATSFNSKLSGVVLSSDTVLSPQAPTIDQVIQDVNVTHLPQVEDIPKDPTEVDQMTEEELLLTIADVQRKLLQGEALISEVTKAVHDILKSPDLPQTDKTRIAQDWKTRMPDLQKELVRIEAIRARIIERLQQRALSFSTEYAENFSSYYPDATATVNTAVDYLTADLLYGLYAQGATDTITTATFDDYIQAKLGAWLIYLQSGQLPDTAKLQKYGMHLYHAVTEGTQNAGNYFGSLFTFQPIEQRTAGWYMTETTFATNLASGAVKHADVTGLIELTNGMKIYILTATKPALGILQGAIGRSDNTPVSLETFIQALKFKIGDQTPTEDLINKLDSDDAALRELLRDVNLDPYRRPEDPYLNKPRPIPLPRMEFEDFNEGCLEPVNRHEVLTVIAGYYTHYASDLFKGMSNEEITVWIKNHAYTRDRYQHTLSKRTADNNSSAISLIFSEIPADETAPVFLGAVFHSCSDGSDVLPKDIWVPIDVFSRLSITGVLPNKPFKNLEAFYEYVKQSYPYEYGQ